MFQVFVLRIESPVGLADKVLSLDGATLRACLAIGRGDGRADGGHHDIRTDADTAGSDAGQRLVDVQFFPGFDVACLGVYCAVCHFG